MKVVLRARDTDVTAYRDEMSLENLEKLICLGMCSVSHVKNDFKNLANKSRQFEKLTLLKANANLNTNSC